jgi:tRNA threonylcarbamoyladenosine biosynthesis protein TsaB
MTAADSSTSELSPPADLRATVLALDTTAGCCSVALSVQGRVIARAEPMIQGHSRHVLGMIEAVIAESGLPADHIAAIGFGCGPGSFTGLRVACGVAQGLGLGWDRPLVAVDSLLTLAWLAAHSPAGSELPQTARIAVALDLRMQEICHAIYPIASLRAAAQGGSWPQLETGPVLGPADRARDAFDALDLDQLVLAGDGFAASALLAQWRAERGAAVPRPQEAVQPLASAVATLAAIGLRAGRAVPAQAASPWYLRDKVALNVTEQAALRAARAAAR